MSSVYAATAVQAIGSWYQDGRWETWLSSRVEFDWRPGEWNPATWLFTGDRANSRTVLHKCAVHACMIEMKNPGSFCPSCRRSWSAVGGDRDAFAATHIPPRRQKAPPGSVPDPCAVRRGDIRCRQGAIDLGLCRNHANKWRWVRTAGQGTALTLAEWASTVAEPYIEINGCLVLGCDIQASGISGVLCEYHNRRWRKDRTKGFVRHGDVTRWAATQAPYLSASRFSLAPLHPVTRWEVLYGLQRRDAEGRLVNPRAMREVVQGLLGQQSLLTPDINKRIQLLRSSNGAFLLDHIHRLVLVSFDEFRGVKPIDKVVLDLQAIGLKGRTRSGQRIRHGLSDVRVVTQPWLRSLLCSWVDGERPTSNDYTKALRAVTLASDALRCRPGGGDVPAALGLADMEAVADQFRTSLRKDGKPYKNKHRQDLFARFCVLLDFGRRAGLLEELPGGFARHNYHRISRIEENEDEIGKAIPKVVIDQLDAHVGLIGSDVTYGRMQPENIRAMFRAAYFVLRDTGRRPLEVVSLPRDCLETIDGETSLVWDNGKGRRNKRRLPIDQSTAEEIRCWQRRRDGIATEARADGFLFPAATDEGAFGHLDSNYLAVVIRRWVDSLPALDTDTVGHDGEPVPFDRAKVFPYAFRHSYAQRHADEGTPVDVLKELMDHAQVSTTMGYYKIPLKRKQQAVKTLSAHTLDRSGKPMPFHSGLAYQRGSVAVPFGGCVEPSNVKAGGNACRIRFQCAGCGFYRPDPSYLPAIEQQINDLRADLETAEAMGAAEFVIRNLTDQIDAYRDVITKMRKRLAELPPDERAEIEEASTIMRKARAGSRHLRLPITPVQRSDSPR